MTNPTTAAARAILAEMEPNAPTWLEAVEARNGPPWQRALRYATAALTAAEKAGSVGEAIPAWKDIRRLLLNDYDGLKSQGLISENDPLGDWSMDAAEYIRRSASPNPPTPASETSATPAEGVDLEGVARIIDPDAYSPTMPNSYKIRQRNALAKAAQIAALFPTPPALPDELVATLPVFEMREDLITLLERQERNYRGAKLSVTTKDRVDAVLAFVASRVRSLQKEKTDGR